MADRKTTKKPRTRTVSRKSSKKSAAVPSIETRNLQHASDKDMPTPHVQSPRRKRIMTIIALVILVLIGLGYLVKTQLLVALVNNEPVFRWTVVKQLEQRHGAEIIDNIVINVLVKQEASKKGVTVTSDEVQAEYQTIEKNVTDQGQKLDELLSMQGMTTDDLREQLRYKIMLEKLVGEDITVTDEDVNAFIEERKEFIEKDADMNKVREEVRSILKEQKLNEKATELTERLKNEASIQKIRNY